MLKLLKFQYKELEFAGGKVCKGCPSLVKPRHKEALRRQCDGREPKSRISICVWDVDSGSPILSANGKPLRFSVSENHKLCGGFRKKDEQSAEEEVSYPYHPVNMDIENIPSPDVEEIELPMNKLRQSKRRISDDPQKLLIKKIKEFSVDGLIKYETPDGKGMGVKTTRSFHIGEFICEYVGELIDKNEANQRELIYGPSKNCYIYYFNYNSTYFCIDATDEENTTLGKYINHSILNPNIQKRLKVIDGIPRLYFQALKDLPANTELVYDYADPSPDPELTWYFTS